MLVIMPNMKKEIDEVDKKWAVIFNAAVFIVLVSPGVWYFGCVYALAAQLALVCCVYFEKVDFIVHAARLSIFAAVSNLLLSIVIWKSLDNILYIFSAALRAAVVSAVSVSTIVTSNTLLDKFS